MDQATKDALVKEANALKSSGATILSNASAIATFINALPVDPPPPPPGPTAPFSDLPRLLWHDEFDGTAVDTAKWNVRDGNYEGNDLSVDLAANVSVVNSALVIQPKREDHDAGATTRHFTTGYLDCHGKMAVPKPSYTEFRSRLPVKPNVSAGLWPAIWFRLMIGKMEIDLMEAWGTPSLIADTSGKFQFAIGPDTNDVNANGYHGWYTQHPVDLTQWHTYGLRIEPDGTLSMYFDGQQIGFEHWVNGVLAPIKTITPAMIPGLAWDPTVDSLGVRINLQVGQPSYYGPPNDQTDFSQHYDTDYVRCWTKAA